MPPMADGRFARLCPGCAGKPGRRDRCHAASRPEESRMSDSYYFAALVLLIATVGLLAVLSNRLTERIHVPAPLLVLVAAAVTVQVVPSLDAPSDRLVERVVTLALVWILFDGGQHMGWTRFRDSATPIVVLGVVGTFLTVAAIAAC